MISKAKRENGTWVYGYFVKYPDGSTVIFDQHKWESFPVKEITLCRCLDELDKNGDFIFENDIINDFGGGTWVENEETKIEGQAFPEMVRIGDSTRLGVVVAEDGTTRVRVKETNYSFNISNGYKLSDTEIVGNVFD